jgi:hypothetical protein
MQKELIDEENIQEVIVNEADVFDDANPFSHAWKAIESEETKPHYVRNVRVMGFDEFESKVVNADVESAKLLAENLYAGDCYILKGAYSAGLMAKVKQNAIEFAGQHESQFHKMFDGAPNFHRLIDAKSSKLYQSDSRRHIFHFFSWNEDDLGVLNDIYDRWQIFKFLSGRTKETYQNNIPSDGVVDRFHVYHYPAGGGSLTTHLDPTRNQKTIIAGMMSKRGKDYLTGGIYVMKDATTAVDCEPYLDPGDILICYPSVFHGVAPVDSDKDFTWDHDQGRWFLGLYSVDSDYVTKRDSIYTVDVSFPEKFVPADKLIT